MAFWRGELLKLLANFRALEDSLAGTYQPLSASLNDLAALAKTDSNVIVGNGTNWVAESGATARTSLGLGTGDTPQFTGIELGHASDTTLSRGAAGFLAIEGNRVPSPASQALGDILYRGSTEWERLAAGTAGYGLQANGAAAPTWVARREVLTAARTYYVRSDGSDSNTGLADTAGGAFLTIGKALTVTAALDISIYNVTISVASGTWTTALTVSAPWVGSGTVTLQGNGGTLNVTGTCVTVTGSGSRLTVSGFTLVASVIGLDAKLGATITIGTSMVFGACTAAHMRGNLGTIYGQSSSYSVTGAAIRHIHATGIGGTIQLFAATITVTGTLAFTTFADADTQGHIQAASSTIDISGATVTGKRFNAASLGFINTGGGGANFFPGNSAGTGTNPGASPYGLYI